MSKLKRLGTWCSDHADLVVVGVLVWLLKLAYEKVQLIDPRIGFDGWSDTLYSLLALLTAIAALWVGWWVKVRLHGEYTVEEDQWLRKSIREHQGAIWTNSALHAALVEYGITAFWSVLMLWAVFRAANPSAGA